MITSKIFVPSLPGTFAALYTFCAAIGSLGAWTSPVLPKLRTISPDNPFGYAITSSEESWISSLLVLGCCVGCWLFGYLSNRFGRKWVFCSLVLPINIICLLMVIFPTIEVYMVCRFLLGLCLGGGFSVTVSYITEITSASNRGYLFTLSGTFQATGCLYVYSIGPWTSVSNLNLILIIFPLTCVLVVSIFGAETPYFYLLTNREELAKKSLIIFRPLKCDVEKELSEIRNQIKYEQEGNIMDFILTKSILRSFLIGNVLIIFQQLTGINCILMYSQTIFDLTNSNWSPSVSSIVFGVMQLISTLTCPFLIRFIDRKCSLYLSCIGMIVSEAALATYCVLGDAKYDTSTIRFIPITALTIFILSYNLGIGPLCWVMAGELYPTRIRALALSFTVSLFFVVEFILTKYFYTLVDIFGIGTVFYLFTGSCIAAIVFIKFFVIETRNKSLQEIQDILKS